MASTAAVWYPAFDAVKTAFNEELTPCGDIAHWTNPKGGYFINLYVMPGCAKRVAQLCKDCGLTLTGAGSAYPYHRTRTMPICASRPVSQPGQKWRLRPTCSVSASVWPQSKLLAEKA